MRLAHMNNAKSREHAHTCRKARAIFILRYKTNKTTNALSGSVRVPEHVYRKLDRSFWFHGNMDPTIERV